MDDTWWPDLLKHIAQEDPWAAPMVTVAEMRSFEGPIDGQRYSSTALIAPADLERLNGELSSFGADVEINGPRPLESEAGRYRPEFWIEAWIEEECLKLEPLILNWESLNRTTLVLDPGFAMTYGLIPRAGSDGSIHWDDPMEPHNDVAIVDAPAVFEAMHLSPTRARVSRDHLQDYLTLRDRVLVQVYMEVRSGAKDKEISAVLGEDQHLDLVFRDRTIVMNRMPDGRYMTQVRGARVLAGPGALPITSRSAAA
ncbi:hypothetical protein [Novosphingobium terrae]|uniref:hypothetical protein n=1 Tax=Novosphingobium terrae TaxID=2726189 RepID=UPI0019818C75|nr:hypothetical protein [Novosphingobium terrae]